MELKDFIAASLEGIADGIIESSIRLSDKGFIVSPSIVRVMIGPLNIFPWYMT